jgi:hypothetical protein
MDDFGQAQGGDAVSHRDGINGRFHKVNVEILVVNASPNGWRPSTIYCANSWT